MSKKTSLRILATVSLFLLSAGNSALAEVIFVDASATGNNNGANWTDAYIYLQDALDEANTNGAVTEIHVAQGIYKPDQGADQTPGDREATFRLINGVAIYGGFPAGGGVWETRESYTYETELNGDLNGDDVSDWGSNGENSYHIVVGTHADETAVLDGFTITGGNANGDDPHCDGGGMYNSNGSPTLTDCIFRENHATYGGGLMNWESSPTLTTCTFTGNETTYSGSGMYNALDSSPTLINCTFRSNSNTDSSGGGMVNQVNSNPTMIGCTFSGNSSTAGGAIVNSESSPILTNCTFSNNIAVNAGGIYNYINCNPILTNCKFIRNVSSGSGGALINWESSPTLTGCTFAENSASSGSGIYNYLSGSDPTLIDCTFYGNSASSGAGIYNGTDTSSTLTNCTFSGNSASSYGGGMYNNGCYLTLTNCTFIGNSAYYSGGGAYNTSGGNVTLTNCVLWGNTDSDGAEETSQISGGTLIVTYSCVQDDDPNDDYIPFDAGSNGNIDDDPLFVDSNGPDGISGTEDDNPRLSRGSPCIDVGTNGADTNASTNGVQPLPQTDLDGNPRIVDGDDDTEAIVDMGAYEYQGDAGLLHSAPAHEQSLWRTANNFIRLTFNADISAPADGELLIEVMSSNGEYGTRYSIGTNGSEDFVVAVANDGDGKPRTLEIYENGSVLTHTTWIAVRNVGDWPDVAEFYRHYPVLMGDVNADGDVLPTDFGPMFPLIPTFGAEPDDRADVDGDGDILPTDFGPIFPQIPTFGLDVPKPDGHPE